MISFSSTLALFNIVFLALAFIRINSVIWNVKEARNLLNLIEDLEKSALVADTQLEGLIMDKAKDFQEQKLGNEYDTLVQNVIVASGKIVKNKIQHFITPAKKLKWVRLARAVHNLEMQAVLEEYVQKYDSSSLPKDVRPFYTYVASNVEFLNSLKQMDQMLLHYIRQHIIVPPAPQYYWYNLENPGTQTRSTEAEILALFHNRPGLFVECGALDGELHSNTLSLERNYGWSGVLIEADPYYFEIMLTRNRKSWLIPTCLSVKSNPHMSKFKVDRLGWARESNQSGLDPIQSHVDVQCLPLSAILLATEVIDIDFFILNAGGREYEVLKTINLDLVDVKVYLVKISLVTPALQNFMLSNGYRKHLSHRKWTRKYIMFKRWKKRGFRRT